MSRRDLHRNAIESTPASVAIRRQRRERVWGRGGELAGGLQYAAFIVRLSWLLLSLPFVAVSVLVSGDRNQCVGYVVVGALAVIAGLAVLAYAWSRTRRGLTPLRLELSRANNVLAVAALSGPALVIGGGAIAYAVAHWH